MGGTSKTFEKQQKHRVTLKNKLEYASAKNLAKLKKGYKVKRYDDIKRYNLFKLDK